MSEYLAIQTCQAKMQQRYILFQCLTIPTSNNAKNPCPRVEDSGFQYLAYIRHICFQQMQSQSIIIIHPGSQNLRIGRASDLSPHLILHAVARRRLWNGKSYEDQLLPPSVQPVCNTK